MASLDKIFHRLTFLFLGFLGLITFSAEAATKQYQFDVSSFKHHNFHAQCAKHIKRGNKKRKFLVLHLMIYFFFLLVLTYIPGSSEECE